MVTGPAGVDFASSNISITRFAAYDTSADINSAAANSVFKLTAATTTTNLTANIALTAVLISGSGLSLTGNAGVTLTLNNAGSGAVLVTGGSATVSVPTLAFGANEGS